MTIDFLPPLAAIVEPTAAMPSIATTAAPASGVGFGQLVSQGLQQVNRQLLDGQADLQRLAAGEVTNLHQLMIRLEESRISMQLMLQVRNRLLESYQELMRMQV